MSDDHSNVALLLVVIAGGLFLIGALIYTILKAIGAWNAEWNAWKDNDETMNNQARGEQTETIVSKLDDILNELQLSDKVRQRRERSQRESKIEEGSSAEEDTEKVMKVKRICVLGRVHTQSLRDKSLHPDVLAREREDYERCKQDAIALVRQMRHAASRDFSLAHIVYFCMDAEDETEAKRLVEAIDADFIRDEILAKNPQLAATF